MQDLNRLHSQLVTSGIQEKNPGLFQVISQLIKAIKEVQGFSEDVEVVAGTGGGINSLDILTHSDEHVPLPHSRRLIAGTNITFDDTIINERTVNSTVPVVVEKEWSVLTDGDLIEPELIFAGGDVIMVHVP